MPKIKRVGALDGDTLDVELTNSQTLLFTVKPLLNTPPYDALRDPAVFCRPRTDGESVLWPGGIQLSLKMILKKLTEEKEEKNT